jgi:hypothetical protein
MLAGIEKARGALNGIELGIAEARRTTQRFLIERTAAAAEAFAPAAAEVRGRIERLAESASDALDPDPSDGLAQSLPAYEAAVNAVIEAQRKLGFVDQRTVEVADGGGFKELKGLTINLSDANAAIAKQLSEEIEFNEGVALHKMSALLAAMSEKEVRLVAYSEPEYLDVIKGQVATFRELLSSDTVDTDFAGRITPILDGYEQILTE